MAINRISFNRLEILNVFSGSFDSERLLFNDRILRVLARAGTSFGQRINPLIFK